MVSHVDPIRVLIVDDDSLARALLIRHLTWAGYETLEAKNGAEAMKVLLAEAPPVVITDWVMPQMNGVELCRAIRRHEGITFAYVIIVTARQTSQEQLVEAFDAGADDYLCKPYNPGELMARLRAGVRIIKLQEELERRNREVHRYNAEMVIKNRKLAGANRQLHRMATTDELTGLTNRREALRRLSACWASAERHGDALAVIILDIDRFKSCNDAYGHAVGDAILRQTADLLRRSTRRDELVCRIGGEEFLVLLPGATKAMAASVAERLRRAVEANRIEYGDLTLRITVSLGVAERTADMHSPDHLLRAADEALFAAKDAGRNTVCCAGREPPAPKDLIDDLGPAAVRSARLRTQPDDPATVLVVDDDASARLLAKTLLEREGYRTVEAVDGTEALGKVAKAAPDVVVMAAVTPRNNGLECTRRLKGNPDTRHIPVILASSRSDATDIAAGLEAGADEFLSKPINPKELIVRVQTMVRLGRELGRSNEVRGEQSRALGILSDFSHRIATADTLDDVLERTLGAAASLACCRRVSLLLPDPGYKYLRVAKCLGIDEARAAEVCVPVGAPTSGQAFRSKEPVLIESSREANRHGGDPDALLLSGVPSLSIALRAPEHVIGVLNLTGRQGARAFTPTELEYLDLIGNLAAAAIHERLTRRARDEARHSIVIALAKLAERRDSVTGHHVDRVSRFCGLLARQLRSIARYRAVITEEYIDDLVRAVPLHDIGKVAIPDYILRKPESLSPEETTVMRTHTAIGAKTLRSIVERVPGVRFLVMAEEIAAAHHEWYDGTGYPGRLKGDAIPLAARIAAVADVYDAVTTQRPYKKAMPHEEAVAAITQSSGTHFDPDIVEAFLKCEAAFKRLATEMADDVDLRGAAPPSKHLRPPAALIGTDTI